MYKLAILDLDHTLLREDYTISPYSRSILQKCLAQGFLITFATGRMFHSALTYANAVDLNLPLITCQGAAVTALDGRRLYQQPLANSMAKAILNTLKPFQLDVICCHSDTVFAASARDDYPYQESLPTLNHHHQPLPDDIGNVSPLKIGANGTAAEINKALAAVVNLWGDDIHAVLSSANFLEITHRNATKSSAAAQLIHYLGLKPQEVIAIGDSMNDLDLLQFAGLGAAVANAAAPVLAAADQITASNDEDGPCRLLEQLILK